MKILDFGLAKLMDPTARMRPEGDSSGSAEPVTLTAAPLTVEGSIMGTVNYMSPEQAEGLKVDARSDIFAFGAVLYEMVTGQRAFDGDSGISTLSAVLRDEVKPIREIAPDVPAELDGLIAQCLRKNPDDRIASMALVATALTSLRARVDAGVVLRPVGVNVQPVEAPAVPTTPPTTPPVTAPRSTPGTSAKKTGANRTILLGATFAAVLVLAVAGAWWQTHRQSAAPAQPQPSVVTTVPPTPQPPPEAPAEPTTAPTPEPAAKNDAADAIASTAAPPPSTPNVPLVNKSKTLPPPPVVTPPSPVQSHVTPTPAPPVPAASVPHAPAAADAVPVKLNDGLPFRIALLEDVPAEIDVDHALRFRVLDGLQVDGVVVIAKGSVVTGSVTSLGGKRNFFGERSKVRFRLISAESVDDAKINVRATPAAKNDGVETRSFDKTNGTKDKSLIAASGAEYVAYVAGEQTVHVHK